MNGPNADLQGLELTLRIINLISASCGGTAPYCSHGFYQTIQYEMSQIRQMINGPDSAWVQALTSGLAMAGLGSIGGGGRTYGPKGLARNAGLPTSGGMRYVPPRVKDLPGGQLPRTKDGGYIDREGRIWRKGPSRTAGEPYEWDVTLNGTTRWVMPNGDVRTINHFNVSLQGQITHISKV